jgi:cation:H+ antiporter
MFSSFALPVLVLIFLGAAALVWVAGTYLSSATDILSDRFGLGQALGGLLLLALVTNLPEIAITVSAALSHNIGIAIGNILGGIALQTVVLVALDGFGVPDHPLTYRAASLVLVLEGALVIGVLGVVLMASQLPASLVFVRVGPGAFLIAVVWLVGIWLLNKARRGLPWHEQGDAPGGQKGEGRHGPKGAASEGTGMSTLHAGIILRSRPWPPWSPVWRLKRAGTASQPTSVSAVFYSAARFLLPRPHFPSFPLGSARSNSAITSWPSAIFSGQRFLPVLFLVATLLSGQSVLPHAQKTDIY